MTWQAIWAAIKDQDFQYLYRTMENIRMNLAPAYASSLPASESNVRWPTAQGDAQLHWDVFAQYGIPPQAFGGTPFGQGIGPVAPGIWCPNCR